MRAFLSRIDPGYMSAALLPLIGILPTLGSGVINTADGPLHVQRIHAMGLMLQTGNLWPRWVPYFHLGYGYPIFNFYPPGVFYLGGLLAPFGINAAAAFNLLAAAAWVIGSVGMYRLARRFLPGRAALLAAMLWAYAPSRLFEVWDQGSLPQMMAAALIPWLFAGLVACILPHPLTLSPTRGEGGILLWRMLGIALPLAGIILTHQPVTFIVALYVVPLAMLVIIIRALVGARHTLPSFSLHPCAVSLYRKSAGASSHKGRGTFREDTRYPAPLSPTEGEKGRGIEGVVALVMPLVGGLLLGAALTAIFWLPLALELRYVKSSEIASDTVPYLISNFLQPAEIFMQPPPMDLTDLRYELTPTLGLVGGIFAAVGLGALALRRRWGLLLALGAGLLFTLFMLLEESLPVWLAIPYFAQLRFPERFLRVGAVLIALAGGASLLVVPQRWQKLALALGLIVVLVAALPLVYPNQEFVAWENLSAVDEINMELTAHVWGSTSYNEFNPRWGEKILYDEPETAEYITNPMRLTVYRLDMIRQWPDLQVEELDDDTIQVTVTDARPVRFRQYYFPGWAAALDGQRVEVYPEDEIGLLTVDVPPGEHVIELWYEGTPAQMAGAVISAAALGAVIIVGLRRIRYGFTAGAQPATSRPRPLPTPHPCAAPLYRKSAGTSPHLSRTTPSPPAALFPTRGERGWGLEGLSRRPALLISAAVIAFALVNTYILAPRTLFFRHRSPPDQPVYMQHEIRQSFGGVFELLGYSLSATTAATNDSIDVTLFWRAQTDTIERQYRPIVQIVDVQVSYALAVSEPFFPGGGQTDVPGAYPRDRFASEVHALRLPDDAAFPFGRVLVKMVEARSGEPLRLPDGRDYLLLDPLIVIHPLQNVRRTLNITFGAGEIELWCASVIPPADSLTGDVTDLWLYWHTRGALPDGLTVFVHGLDAAGQLVETGDAPLLGGHYPTSRLPPGLTFEERYTLPDNPAITQIAVGLYTGAGRLPVLQSDYALLPLTETRCQ